MATQILAYNGICKTVTEVKASQLTSTDVSIYALRIECSRQFPEVFVKYGVCTVWMEQMET